MVDTESMTRGAALAERPRRTPTFRRRRRIDRANDDPAYAGRHRVPCQSPPTLSGVPARVLCEEVERAEARALLAQFDERHEAWAGAR